MYRNKEGFKDPTAGEAIGNVMRAYRKAQKEKFRIQYEIRHRPKAYAVSPYAGNTRKNVRDAIRYCLYLIENGRIPVASHLIYPQILDDNDPASRELGLMFGLSLLEICDEVWVFTENGISEGMRAEIHEARKLRKKIIRVREAVQ